MNKLNELTIKEASEKLAKGEITSVDLTNACLDRAKEVNSKINAYINILEEYALTSARESDERRKSGKILSKIDGIPIAIKDNMAMDGFLTTAGSKILANFKPPYDATVIKKLKDAGAVIIGKTNMDEFAMGSSTETSYFGPTKNPYDLERVPGGSSGGSAAAVAADTCIAALGSDTGGSIRQPASFCNCFGLKPTYDAVSRYGLFAMASSLDQIGPITKTCEDAQILSEILYGKDQKDATSLDSQQFLNKPSDNIKVGIVKQFFEEGLDVKVGSRTNEAIEKLKEAGYDVQEVSLPHIKYSLAIYYLIMTAEVSSNLARYDGMKYGLSAGGDSLIDVYKNTRTQGFGEEARRRIMLGTFALSAGYYDAYYKKAQATRAVLRCEFDEIMKKVDVLIGPTSPTLAFKIGEKVSDPLSMYLSDIYTVSANLLGAPAISAPVGFIDGLPCGLQIMGRRKEDGMILKVAEDIEGIYKEIKGELQI